MQRMHRKPVGLHVEIPAGTDFGRVQPRPTGTACAASVAPDLDQSIVSVRDRFHRHASQTHLQGNGRLRDGHAVIVRKHIPRDPLVRRQGRCGIGVLDHHKDPLRVRSVDSLKFHVTILPYATMVRLIECSTPFFRLLFTPNAPIQRICPVRAS